MSINSFDNYYMSWRPELRRDGAPLYLSLAEQLERDIASGRLLPGTKLPPQRELADFLGINLSTISRAFKLCSQKGLLTGSVGSGTYVSYNGLTNLFEAEKAGTSLIRLDSMTPETLVQGELIELLKKMIGEQDFSSLFQYSFDAQDWQRQAACALLGKVGCAVSPDNILTAEGGQNAISSIFAGLFKPGDRLGVDPLVYPGVISAAKLFGVQLIPIEQENGEMSEDGLLSAIKNDGIRGIYIVPDYQNPTAHVMSTECRKMIASIAREHELIVIEDGICKLLTDASESVYSKAPDNTVFILSLSKTVSPALKLAYLAVPQRFYSSLRFALYNINFYSSALLMELSSRLIASGKIDELLKRRAEGIEKRNDLVDIILKGYQVNGNRHSLSRWLILPDGMSSSEFEKEALSRGVSVYGSEHFAVGKNPPVEGVRLAICAPSDLDELEKAMIILRDILR